MLSKTDIPLFSVFILTLLLLSSYVNNLLPCKFQVLMTKNMYLKHFIAYMTLIIFVLLTLPSEEPTSSILYSLHIYLIFILVMKTEYHFFLTILILLLFSYIFYLYHNNQINKEKKNPKTVAVPSFVSTINQIINFVVVCLTIVGVLVYMGQKKYIYKKNFNYVSFFLGKEECLQNHGYKLTIMESIRNAFT